MTRREATLCGGDAVADLDLVAALDPHAAECRGAAHLVGLPVAEDPWPEALPLPVLDVRAQLLPRLVLRAQAAERRHHVAIGVEGPQHVEVLLAEPLADQPPRLDALQFRHLANRIAR